ncbi:hypothetical protein BGZ52_001820, partial [Haplosporangium bisporale]
MDTIFIDAPVQEQVAELATYISSLRGDEEQALVKEVAPLVEAEKFAEATKVLVKESKTLLEAPEKEFEAAFNLLVAVAIVDADKTVVEDILKVVVSEPTQKTALKFKVYDLKEILSNIFNTLPANSPLRLSVFTSIVDLAVASDDMDLVLPQLQYVPNWVSEWGVGADAERTLLLNLSDRLKETGN